MIPQPAKGWHALSKIVSQARKHWNGRGWVCWGWGFNGKEKESKRERE